MKDKNRFIKALHACFFEGVKPAEHASDIGSANAVAFDWVEAPEGYTFWSDICHELIRGEYHFTEEESKGRVLPTESAERKTYPIYSGFIRNAEWR